MKLEKDLPDDLEIPGVPDLLRHHLVRKLRGPAKRVKIESELPGKTYSYLNGIKLAERGAANSNPDIDAVSELITRVLHAHHLENQGADNYTSKYRITCEIRSDRGKTPISEPQFKIRYTPGENDDAETDVIREASILDDALHMQRQAYETLAQQNSELHEVVIDFARMMVEPIRASVDMQANATMQWINGANMLVQGHTQMYNVSAVQEAERAKTERVNAILMKFGAPLAEMSAGLIGTIMKKFGVSTPSQAGVNVTEQPKATENTEAQVEEAEDEQVDDSKVIAMVCEVFGGTITAKQRKLMNENLSHQQVAALDNIFAAETNDEVAVAWTSAYKDLEPKIMWLASILSSEQQSDFLKIKGMIERYIEKNPVAAQAGSAPATSPKGKGKGK